MHDNVIIIIIFQREQCGASCGRHSSCQQRIIQSVTDFDKNVASDSLFFHIAKVCFAQCSTSRLALGSPGCSSVVRHHAQNTL